MKPPAELIATFIILLFVVWYSVMSGSTAGWYARLADEPSNGRAVVVGTLWPVTAPVLLGVQVYRTMEAGR